MTAVGRRRLLGLVIAALVLLADQWIKWFVTVELRLWEVRAIDLSPWFDLRWAQNYGVSFSMFSATSVEMRWLLVLLTTAIAAGVLFWMMVEKAMADIAALAMVLGGALGNIRDRATNGYVIDYADLHWGSFRPFQIFNLADAAISVGVVIILARSFLSREKRANTPGGHTPEKPSES